MSYQGSNLWKQPPVKKKKQKRQTITELIERSVPRAPSGSYTDESDIHSINLQMRYNGGKRRRGRKSIKDIKDFYEKHHLTFVNKNIYLYFD